MNYEHEEQTPEQRRWSRVRELEQTITFDEANRMVVDLEERVRSVKREKLDREVELVKENRKLKLELEKTRNLLEYGDDLAKPIEELQEAVKKYPQYVRTTRCGSCSQHKRIDELESKLRDVSETALRYKQERDELQWMYDDLCK